MRKYGDGIDEQWPVVDATSINEALRLGGKATEPVIFELPNGDRLTFTGHRINFKRLDL